MRVRPLTAIAVGSFFLGIFAPSAAPVAAADSSTVTISQGVDTDTLDPLATTVTPSDNVQLQLFDTLVRHDRTGKIMPWLATSFAHVKPDVWEFKLRHNVKFWNGDPLTSADVKFTIEKVKDPKFASQQTPRVNTIAQVVTPDPYTVDFVTTKPTPLIPGFPWLTTIVDAKYWQAHGDAYMADHPMGSGAYMLKRWVKDDELDMDDNPNWWGWNGKPAPIKHVIFKPIPEAAARVAALRTGETDLITNVPAQDIPQIEAGKNTKTEQAKSDRVLFFAFNTFKPGPQDNRLVRQALNYAVNVPEIIKDVLGGHGYPVVGPIPSTFFGYDPSIPAYRYNPAKAKELLAKAGYPDGKGLSLVVNAPIGRYNKDKEIGEAVAGQLQAVGINAQVKIQEWTNYVGLVGQRALEPMYELGWGNDSFDADNTLSSLFTTNSRISTYGTPELDKILTDARFELDTRKRLEDYSKALHIIETDAPWIFLLQYQDVYGTSKRLIWRARGDELFFVNDMKLAG